MAYLSTSVGSDLLASAARDRDAVFALVGQLVSKLAEVDLALLTMVSTLKRDDVIAEYAAEWKTDERFKLVERLLHARGASEALLADFLSIRAAAKPLLDRRAIAAHNVAVLSWAADRQSYQAGLLLLKKWVRAEHGPELIHPARAIEADVLAADAIVRRFKEFMPAMYREILPPGPGDATFPPNERRSD
jgi:hypothetical protein